jgi:hypothetical protein
MIKIPSKCYAKKPTPLPKGVIFSQPYSGLYNLISLKDKRLVGTMSAISIINDGSYYPRKTKNDKIFHIFSLNIKPQNRKKGWGEYFIKFAKNESFKCNCHGRISLVAYNYDVSPHAFYYKQGFVTLDEDTNKTLAEHVKNHWIPFHWDAMEMYLPENYNKNTIELTTKKENKLLAKICSFLKIFNKH